MTIEFHIEIQPVWREGTQVRYDWWVMDENGEVWGEGYEGQLHRADEMAKEALAIIRIANQSLGQLDE